MTEAEREYRNYINTCWIKDICVSKRLSYYGFHLVNKNKGCMFIFDKFPFESWDKMDKRNQNNPEEIRKRRFMLEMF